MDRWQYLMVLGACLLLTAPLEWLGTGVYRRARRTVRAVVPVAAVFVVRDVVAMVVVILELAVCRMELFRRAA